MKARDEFHILVVEDHEEIRNSVCDVLENEGYRVSHAKDGLEGLAMVINGPKAPDLCVLDLMMPVMSGQKLLEAFEEDKHLRKIPVIVMTASGTKPESKVVVATIAKPFAIQDLLDLVTFQLSRSTATKA